MHRFSKLLLLGIFSAQTKYCEGFTSSLVKTHPTRFQSCGRVVVKNSGMHVIMQEKSGATLENSAVSEEALSRTSQTLKRPLTIEPNFFAQARNDSLFVMNGI